MRYRSSDWLICLSINEQEVSDEPAFAFMWEKNARMVSWHAVVKLL